MSSTPDPRDPRPPRSAACPICARPSIAQLAPFCSDRCRDRDLLNWLDERYRVPVAIEDDSEGSDEAAS